MQFVCVNAHLDEQIAEANKFEQQPDFLGLNFFETPCCGRFIKRECKGFKKKIKELRILCQLLHLEKNIH